MKINQFRESNLRKTKLYKYITLLFVYLILCLYPSFVFADGFKVSFKEETLSVAADKVPLQAILLEIVKSGITVKIDPRINPLVTVNFKNRPIEQALETLLKTASYSLLWESRSGMSGDGIIRLSEIQVFQSERKNLMKPLLEDRTVEIIKNRDGILYVKDEILLYLPIGTNIHELTKLVQTFDATIYFNGVLPGPARILLPPDSDVFAIARAIKDKLGISISQPNFAYPLENPVNYRSLTDQISIDTGSYRPSNNVIPIAILDSGLADDAGLDKFVMSSLDAMNPNVQITDSLGHGTQMAYIATGIIKPFGSDSETSSYMPIIPIRAFDDNGYTTDYNILNSIKFALQNKAKVMSLSWGSETKSGFMEKAFENAREQGLFIVASAGNEPTGKPVYPAAYPSVIGVGALEPHGRTWEKSNYGNFVMLYAPGFANLPVGHKGEPGLYAGTSIATAYVANSIADYLSRNPTASLQEIEKFLANKY